MYGSLGGVPFRVDPNSVSWSYTPKVNTTPTVGGRVVQVIGSTLSNMKVAGTFGYQSPLADDPVKFDETWQVQQRFLDKVDAWVQNQVGDLTANAGSRGASGVGLQNGNPIRFLYSDNDGVSFDFMVYIVSFKQPNSSMSIRLEPSIFAPNWEFEFFIYQDNSGLSSVTSGSMINHIRRISGTFGWYPTKYTGPVQPGQYPKLKEDNPS